MKARRVALFACLLLLLDWLLFDLVLFALPAFASWDMRGRFTLERQIRTLRGQSPSFAVIGSSVARYGVLGYEERLLSRNGLNPWELLALSERLDLQPGLFIVLVHPVDFRLERAFVRQKDAWLDLYELSFVREIHPATALFTAPHKERPAALLSLLLRAPRYGGILRESAEIGQDRSYRNYQGSPIRGLNRRGWLAPEFALPLTENVRASGLILQLPERLRAKAVTLELSTGEERETHLLRPGWQEISLAHWPTDRELRGRFSHSFEEDGLALVARLPQWFGVSLKERWQEKSRPRVLEDDVLARMTEDQVERFHAIRQDNLEGPGKEYLKALALLREDLSRSEFQETEPAFILFRQALTVLGRKAPVLLVNVPENPLSLARYGNSAWYSGYMSFLKGTAACFSDESRLLGARYFYDTHHLSYDGARVFTARLERLRAGCSPAEDQ